MMSFATSRIDGLWAINFDQISGSADNLPSAVSPTTLVSIDTVNGSGTIFRNNRFSRSNCNCGRWKSSGGLLHNTTFEYARLRNLEIYPLPSWFEGPTQISNVTIRGNTFIDEGQGVVHLGPTATGSTGVHAMWLVNRHGYFSGAFDLAPTAGVTGEAACVRWCNLTSNCVAATWPPRPSNPCVMYTAITSNVVAFAGCDNWVKQQPLPRKNST